MNLYQREFALFALSSAVLFTSSSAAADDNQIVGGLYRNGELVDSLGNAMSLLDANAHASSNASKSKPVSDRAEKFRKRIRSFIPEDETRDRNRSFVRAADAGVRIRELIQSMNTFTEEDSGTGRDSLQTILSGYENSQTDNESLRAILQDVGALPSDRESLQDLLGEIEATNAEVRESLNRIEDRIIELNLGKKVRKRHIETVQAFEEGSEAISAAIGEVIDGVPGAIESALELLKLLKFREDPPLLSSGLPFEKHVIEAPRLTREEADAALKTEAQVDVVPKAAAQADLPVAALESAPPTADDLAETPDIQFTPEISAKAAELGNSPLAMYEFVRNNVSFQPYVGSRKGAANTLEQLRGNDTDQASLLLALLRVSGIASRYVRATVEMTPESAKSWLGVDDAYTASGILTTAGLDGVAIMNGSEVVAVRSTHVWVEAYLPYSNYRGIANDNSGRIWVPLDPSFKGSDITPGEDILASMGFDVDSFIDDYLSTVAEPDPLEKLELDMQAYLDANDPGKTLADIERRQRVAAQHLGIIPASPAFSVRTTGDRLSELEDSIRYKVRFHLYSGGTDFIDHTINLIELAGKRLTIEYIGATQTDQDTIDSFGGIYETPPNLVNVRPVLELDGVAIATSTNSIGMGYTHSSDMQFIAPTGASNPQPFVQNDIIAGNGQAIGFDTFLDVDDAFMGGESFSAEDFLEAILHTTATDYLSRVDRGLEKAGRLMGVVTTQDVSEVIAENAISVSYSYGIPVTFEWTGLIVDADRRIIGTFDVDGDHSQDIPYMKLTGVHGSLMENRVFEEMFDQNAVSTIKILQLASEAGIGICTIQTSVYGDCPGITQPSYVVSALNTALAQGHVITIPEDPITVSQWSGTGYIDMDPATGAGGYIIAGGISGVVQTISGGATVESWPVKLPCEATDVTGNVLSPAADSPDPSAVFCADDTTLSFKVEFTSTCKDGSTKTHQQTFTTSKTKEQIGGGNYTLELQAFGSSTIIRKISIIEVESETVSTIPADRDRTTLGIGERVTLSTNPSMSVTWSVTGGGSVMPTTASSTMFTASHSPSTSTVQATIGSPACTKVFTVIAPSSITSTKKTDVGHGTAGPPNNQIGAYTIYDITVNPKTVSFTWAELRENIPSHSWTWPNGAAGGISAQTVEWNVGYANDTTDDISSGPYPIGRIHNGTDFVNFDYEAEWKEEYKNEAGTWTEFVAKEDRLTEYRGSDQKCRQTHMGAPGGWQGPWQ